MTQLVKVEGKHNIQKTLFLQPLYNERSLSDVLKKVNENDIETKKSLALQMLTACSKLTEKNVIHKDIKPDNFLVKKIEGNQDSYEVALTDFGCAEWSHKKTGQIAGTQAFMSPEYFFVASADNMDNDKIKEVTTEKHDAWALGITLFEMFTGVSPAWCAFTKKFNFSLNLKQDKVDAECNKIPDLFRPLVADLLKVDPNQRLSASDALTKYRDVLGPIQST